MFGAIYNSVQQVCKGEDNGFYDSPIYIADIVSSINAGFISANPDEISSEAKAIALYLGRQFKNLRQKGTSSVAFLEACLNYLISANLDGFRKKLGLHAVLP